MTRRIQIRHGFALAGIIGVLNPASAQPELITALKGQQVKGFTLARSTGTTAVWTAPGGARLTLTLSRKVDPARADAKVKATNKGVSGEELLFLCENSGTNRAWTNYRSDHGTTFTTYRYWRLERDILLTETLVYPKKPGNIDAARQGFVTMRKTSTELFRRLAGK